MLDKQGQKQLQRLMQDPKWEVVEIFLELFLKEKFLTTSLKKENEFETLWYAAFSEGGKYYLQEFMRELENNAHLLEE